MRKLLICVLSACAFIGITGCSNEKKMSAKEAETTIKAAAENTQKKLEEKGTISAKNSIDGTITSNEVKLSSSSNSSASLRVLEKAKINVKAGTSETLTYNITDKKAKITADANAKIDANITSDLLKNNFGWTSPKKINYEAKANGEVYYISGSEQANIYAKYNAELNDQLVTDFDIENKTYTGKYNFKSLELKDLFNDILNDDDTDTSTTTTDDDFIKDWTIFKKKGNVIIADCSNLEAFNLGEDFTKIQNELKDKGIVFKVSKFQLELNKDTTIKNVDFVLSLDGNVDLSKLGFDAEAYQTVVGLISMAKPEAATILAMLPIDTLSGTITLDLDLNEGFAFNYAPEAIVVPDELINEPETEIDEKLAFVEFMVMGMANNLLKDTNE